MIDFLKILGTIIISLIIGFSNLYLYYSLNIKKEYRYKHQVHLWFLILDIFSISSIYFLIYIIGTFKSSVMDIYNDITSSNLVLTIILSTYLLFKLGYKIYFMLYQDKIIKETNVKLPKHYYLKDNRYYLSTRYIMLFKVFRYSMIVLMIILALALGIIDYICNISFQDIFQVMQTAMVLLLLLMELSIYFDGYIENISDEVSKKNKKNNLLFKELDEEYHRLWDKKLLASYNTCAKYEDKIIDGSDIDIVSMNITKGISVNEVNDYLYSKILSPIITGKNIIIENCMLFNFVNLIIPIINIMFTASKRIMFICDSYENVKQCAKWLEKMDITNSNMVIDILSYDNMDSIKIDSNIDIYIGTVDLVLNSRAIFENIDVVFGLNIDNIISTNALNLNLLASNLSTNRCNSIQYVLFGNRVNGLKQAVSQIFMKNDFEYHVVNNGLNKQINANFWPTEKGWFQSAILPGVASQNLGQLLPLSIPGLKYGFEHINIISENQTYNDHIISLKTTYELLKKYINKNIVNIEDAFYFNINENFIELDNNSVVVVDDAYNNLALVLLNWLKYTNTNMYLNIVSMPYILRDYIISNIDFFISNVDAIGNIIPVSNSNIKLSVYRIISQLCYGNVSEDVILRELKNQDMKIKLDTFNHDQVRFITESLESLTKKAFGINIFFKSYLISKKVYKGKNLEFRRYYKLLDTIKKELPDKLFKNIIFIDSEQSEKILKKIPVFELYQNYLEGQYVTFDGKYYLINKIDYDAGIVNLIYSSNTNNIRYRQIREISNIKHLTIIKELPVLRIRDSVLKKYILCAELEVNTNGYYEFNNAISFVPGEFGYKQVDANKKGLHRKYKYTNVLVINIFNKTILSMTELERFKLSFTLSVLLNEIFETLFSNIKQYILVRNVIKDSSVYAKYSNDELINLYKPIIDSNASDGINIYITEDTELEKGVTDSIADNFDNVIIRLLYDYLYWLIKESCDKNNLKWYESRNGDYVNISKIDKLSFLKYGANDLCEYIDLEGIFNCLSELILEGNNTLTYNRIDFINKRKEVKDFSFSVMDVKENKKKVKDNCNKNKESKEDKSFIERVKEIFIIKKGLIKKNSHNKKDK